MMDTKTFVNQLSQITKSLLAMIPAQREIVHQSIQASQGEISVNELIQPLFNRYQNALIVIPVILKNGGKLKFNDITVIVAIRLLITRQKVL